MKKVILSLALVAAVVIVGTQNVHARAGMGPEVRAGAGQSAETIKARQQFHDETVELRRQIVGKQTALQAVLAGDRPDPEVAAALATELFDLRTEKHLKARELGVDLPAAGMGMGRMAHGKRGMMSGRGQMGPGAGQMSCPMMGAGSDAAASDEEAAADGNAHSHH
ncbi:hypothetical protein [Desulfurivibrio alkaliphilus]|uniref:Zinc resistance-associated protein n=1 Tax=Desulfurivibrio alkaliphilus (strain DSM 19089 / UNIQEM U267 / AHT2) TaxID=589865 RepID=D6Z163_DESAT|nr:hypothetical protein [Desulfurivibrio alkaliphilus]ADH85318.1 conserved hypothetical protein [Desulfurivibrio alkaliphilus AHT 2]